MHLLVLLTAVTSLWHPPVGGPPARSFRFDARRPYEAGWRRGMDLRARPGEPVRAACPGVVTYAGAVPRAGLGVTVRCGGLVATHLGLASVRVRRGARVRAGTRLGAAAGTTVRLGARRAGDRQGYVDPAALLRAQPDPLPSPPPAPPWTGRHLPPLSPARRPDPPAAARVTPATPLVAWLGLGLLALGIPAGGALRLRARRRRRAPADLSPRGARAASR